MLRTASLRFAALGSPRGFQFQWFSHWFFIDFGTLGASISMDFGTLGPPFSGLGAVLATRLLFYPFFLSLLGGSWGPLGTPLAPSWGHLGPQSLPRGAQEPPKWGPRPPQLGDFLPHRFRHRFVNDFEWFWEWFFNDFPWFFWLTSVHVETSKTNDSTSFFNDFSTFG